MNFANIREGENMVFAICNIEMVCSMLYPALSDPTDLITREYVSQTAPILLCLLLLSWASGVDKNQDR